jgi:oligopeptidase A
MEYPFLHADPHPQWSQLDPNAIATDIEHAITSAQLNIDALIEKASHSSNLSYESTFQALESALEPLNTAWGLVNHLDSVNNSPALREAINHMLPKVTEFFTNIPLNLKLWNILQRYANSSDANAHSPAIKRHIKETIEDFREEGADLSDSNKERLRSLQSELAELTQKYSENCLDATNAWELIIKDPDTLKGLPKSALQAAKESAIEKGHPKAWRFTLQATSYIPVMTYAENEMLRKSVWEAYQAVGRQAPYDNQPIVQAILKLRHQLAGIIGKSNFADYTTNRRMVKSGTRAQNFIQDMHEKILPAFKREYSNLKTFKNQLSPSLSSSNKEALLEPWEIAYLCEKHRKEAFDFDEEALRPYFPIHQVIDGLFSITGTLFGLTIEEMETQYSDPKNKQKESVHSERPEVWHQDVRLYKMCDSETGAILGTFYADWHPRESKRSGAWMNYLRTGNKAGDPNTHTPHLGLICGNLTPALKDTPALLTHHEVETIFHEFGHLLHHLCGLVEVPSLNGVNVAWDFVELPSQILENWCWERDSLDLFARHYQTNEPIPEALFKKMQASRNHLKALGTMRQLSLSKLDLDLHIDWVLHEAEDLDAYLTDRLSSYQLKLNTPSLPITYNFGHLFSSTIGYAAGYYSYKWAEVLDADAFTRFKDEGLLNPKLGKIFRDTILAKGNSEDPYTLFEDFMGRPPSIESLLKRDGIQI